MYIYIHVCIYIYIYIHVYIYNMYMYMYICIKLHLTVSLLLRNSASAVCSQLPGIARNLRSKTSTAEGIETERRRRSRAMHVAREGGLTGKAMVDGMSGRVIVLMQQWIEMMQQPIYFWTLAPFGIEILVLMS